MQQVNTCSGKVLSALAANLLNLGTAPIFTTQDNIIIGFHVDTAADFDSCSSPTSNLNQRATGELIITQ